MVDKQNEARRKTNAQPVIWRLLSFVFLTEFRAKCVLGSSLICFGVKKLREKWNYSFVYWRIMKCECLKCGCRLWMFVCVCYFGTGHHAIFFRLLWLTTVGFAVIYTVSFSRFLPFLIALFILVIIYESPKNHADVFLQYFVA